MSYEFMNIEDLRIRVQMAINTLYARDYKLFSVQASEW